MRVGLSWLREHVALPPKLPAAELDQALNNLGIEVESIVDLATTVSGSLVVGRVLTIEDLTGFNKPIRFCTVDVGDANGTGAPQEIICGATNFAAGDLVAVILPGGVLPGGTTINARQTYGHTSAGMICSARELGLGEDHSGILVLDPASTAKDVAGGRSGAAKPGADARPLVGLDDIVVDCDITPDRGYQMSVRGLARELSHGYRAIFHDPAAIRPRKAGRARRATAAVGDALGPAVAAGALDAAMAGDGADPVWPVTVVDQAGCDRFALRRVSGVDPAARTPAFMARRLATAGIRTLGLAIDVTNYVMLELGQPMHAFDAQRVRGALVVRRAEAGERLTTLDGVARALAAEDMVICDDTGAVSLAAVMGGQSTEVVAGQTSEVLLEAAHWDPTMVGRTARRHKLFSEAAKRWERGVDRALCPPALERAVALLVEYGGGTAVPGVLDLDYPPPPVEITMAADRPSRLIGVDYPPQRVVALLTEIGCAVGVDGDLLRVAPPSWRPDLLVAADLVEEVVRLDGLDRIPSVLPPAPAGRGLTASQRRRRSVGRTLAEQGYVEALSYPFVSAEVLAAVERTDGAVALANPISAEEPYLRTSLLPPLLAALRRNIGRGQRDVALYEQGLVFQAAGDAVPPPMGVGDRPTPALWEAANATVPRQPWHVAVVLAGEMERTGWWGAGRVAGWSDAVQAARDVLAAAGVPEDAVSVVAVSRTPWHPGRCAAVSVRGEVVGHAGELHPAVCAALDVPRRTCAMELDLDAVALPGRTEAPVVSTYPPAFIDVALVVPAGVPVAEVAQVLRGGAGELLESLWLFDVYTGAQVGAGRKSLAFKLTLRSRERTLTVPEAVAARDAAVAAAASAFGAQLRGT